MKRYVKDIIMSINNEHALQGVAIVFVVGFILGILV